MLKKFFLIICVFLVSLSAFAQKSEEIRKVGRTKYYVHTVQKGHTLYAISRVYSVDVADIIAANPGSEEGIDIGQEILIPIKSVDKKEAKANPPEIEDGQLIHTVKQGETLYGIAKKYKISVEELTKNNQELASGLQPGMKLIINQQTIPNIDSQLIEPALPDDYIKHVVKAKETLYGISKMYNVGIQELIEINPGLSEGLKEGMILNIPKTATEFLEEEGDIQIATLSKPNMKGKYKIALMLPFNLNNVDSAIAKAEGTIHKPVFNSYTLAAAEFYNGFLMAIDSLKEKGLSVDLHVYDLADDHSEAQYLMTLPELKTMDMLIGPFHYSTFKMMAEFANQNGISIVSPINHPNKLLISNTHILESVASEVTQVKEMATYLALSSDSANVLMLSNFDYKVKPLCDEFEKKALRAGLTFTSVSVEFSEREFDLIVPPNLAEKLDSTRVNKIFVISNAEGYLSRLFDRMNAIDTSKFKMEVYGLNSWIKINQINTRYKVKYNVCLPLVNFIDYTNTELLHFIEVYNNKHNALPSAKGYAFIGYDVANYHLHQLLAHGSNFQQYFGIDESFEGLITRYSYKQLQANSGYENSGLYFVRYDDYELKAMDYESPKVQYEIQIEPEVIQPDTLNGPQDILIER